jgi:hypothetical protein
VSGDVKIARNTERALEIAKELGLGPRSFTITIPRSHPKAEALAELARKLACREKDLATGAVVEKFARHDADLVILDALREFVDVDAILRDLSVTPDAADLLRDPRVFGKILETALPLLVSAKLGT